MIKNLTLLILGFLDFFHKKKILNFLVKSNLPIINIFFDIGAHKGETIIFFGKVIKQNFHVINKNLPVRCRRIPLTRLFLIFLKR